MGERRNGATSAWDLIVAERDSMMRVALARTRNRHDAEDLVQEAMARAASLPNLHHRTVGRLLRTIVINLAIDQHRRATTQSRYEARMSADFRTASTVEEEVCDRSEARWLREVISQTPGRDQEVLLHRAAGHSVRTSAQVLGLTYKAAESAFTRARHRARLVWETTLAAFLGSLVWLRRTGKTAPAATAVALTGGLALAVSYLPPRTAEPGAELGVERFSTAIRVEPVQPARDRIDTPAQDTATPRPSAAARLLDTGEVGDREVVSTGVAVEDAHEEESLVATVERCLRNGVVVSPTLVDCR